ncbi:MAG: BACON domain-containing protein [Dysgonamonadaceae bacterium]|jgi:hypothetical protein|nr:BACON domain-containing protein [Dysgonamonadaceae bacterium]
MKKIINNLIIAILCASGIIVYSCDSGTVFSQPEIPPKLETTALEAYTVTATSPREIKFGVNSTTPWTVKSNESWCSASPQFSSVSALIADITVTVERNEATTPRNATLTISAEGLESQTIQVTQESKGNLEVEIIDETDLFVSEGETKTFTIVSNRNWSVSSSSTWLSIDPKEGSAGDNNAISIKATAAPNKATKRTATITVRNGLSEKIFNVVQEGILFSLSNIDDLKFTGGTENKEYELTANIPWEAEIVSGAEWLTLNRTSGSSSAKIIVTAANNATLVTRVGTIAIHPVGNGNVEGFVLDLFQDNMQDGTIRYNFADGNSQGIYAPSNVTFSNRGAFIKMTNEDAENGGGWARIRLEDYSNNKLGIYTWKFSSFNFPENSSTWFDLNAWESNSGNYHLFLNNKDQNYISTSFGSYNEVYFNRDDFDLKDLESITVKIDHDPANSGKLRLEVFFNDKKITDVSDLGNLYAEDPNQRGPSLYYGLMYENYQGAEASADIIIEYFQKTPLN